MTALFAAPRDLGEDAVSANRRVAARLPLVLDAHCAIDFGDLRDVFLINLSLGGCLLFARPNTFRPGQGIVIRRDGGELRRGRVSWAAGMKAGVSFDLAISEECLGSLLTAPSLAQASALDSDQFADRFGRVLAPLPVLSGFKKPHSRSG